MLNELKPQPQDKILTLMQAFREDPRENKIDLGVGVYKNAAGVTPVMRAIKAAEHRLWETQQTKAYTALIGDPAYCEALSTLILGDAAPAERLAMAATPGGTGAIRQAFELIGHAAPDAKVWISAPSWPNHAAILKYLKMDFGEYRYFDPATRGVAFEAMIADLEQVKPGDIVLLHGCCHNPTGANPSLDQWTVIADTLEARGAVPFVDIAYQGFGDGLEQDAAATRLLAQRMPEMLIAASCSKNFGIYRERTGLLMAIAQNTQARDLTQGMLAYLNRQNFSFPPDHGARLVSTILNDAALRADWENELNETREGMLVLRQQLANELRLRTNSDRYDFVADHRGMFSRLGISAEQVEKLRQDFGIYVIGDSRMNIAGLNAQTVPVLAQAVADIGA